MQYFYPRSPCGERQGTTPRRKGNKIFLSTLSLRRATFAAALAREAGKNFYPRSPCGERPAWAMPVPHTRHISIHALLAESDHKCADFLKNALQFLSTLSLRRATFCFDNAAADNGYFYPRSPCGERRKAQKQFRLAKRISIHALLAESDGSHMSS